MPSFSTVLVSGNKRPYTSWTFLVVPDQVMSGFGSRRVRVRGTIEGVEFHGSVARGEGVYRMPVPRHLRTKAGIACGDRVEVFMELDPEPNRLVIPPELQEILQTDQDLASRFDQLPPAHRRAWVSHVADAKRVETRLRRAEKAAEGIRRKKFPGT